MTCILPPRYEDHLAIKTTLAYSLSLLRDTTYIAYFYLT